MDAFVFVPRAFYNNIFLKSIKKNKKKRTINDNTISLFRTIKG